MNFPKGLQEEIAERVADFVDDFFSKQIGVTFKEQDATTKQQYYRAAYDKAQVQLAFG